jgi:hypothetical protein
MSEHQVETLDMYAFINDHCGANYSTCDWSPGMGNVHFNDAGWQAMANKMAPAIQSMLAKRSQQ